MVKPHLDEAQLLCSSDLNADAWSDDRHPLLQRFPEDRMSPAEGFGQFVAQTFWRTVL